MLVERILITSNAKDMVDYTMPTTSVTGEELVDKLKWCSYIVGGVEPKQLEMQLDNKENL